MFWYILKLILLKSPNFNQILVEKTPKFFQPKTFYLSFSQRNFEDFHSKLHRNLAKSHWNFSHRIFSHLAYLINKGWFLNNFFDCSACSVCQRTWLLCCMVISYIPKSKDLPLTIAWFQIYLTMIRYCLLLPSSLMGQIRDEYFLWYKWKDRNCFPTF